LRGIIKSYLSEKQYGFIKGDDGKDYFFHQNSLKNKQDIDKLCEGLYLEFDQEATPKGYSATKISLLDKDIILKYEIPDDIYTSNSSHIKGWNIIENSNWLVIGSSRNSPDSAKADLKSKAKPIGANSLINVKYIKTTGSEAGTGRGTHYYTIHNFKGQAVNIAKKSSYGKYNLSDFKNINIQADKLKNKLVKQTESSQNFKLTLWGVLIVFIIILWVSQSKNQPIPIIVTGVLIVIGFIFIRSHNYDDWLHKMK
jgi:cold shock CspA family protein